MGNLNLFFDVPTEEEDVDLTDYLIHCYLYYELDTPIIYDYDFDKLCQDILNKWDSINHSYKDFVSQDDLKAGTGYSIQRYPRAIVEEAKRRKNIFLQELQHEVDVAKEAAEEVEKPFEFTHTPMETYLLCGAYRDYGFHKRFDVIKKRREIVRMELKRRWDGNVHHEEFTQYCKDHGVTIDSFNF